MKKICFVIDLPFPSKNIVGSFRVEDTVKSLRNDYEITVICRKKLRGLDGVDIIEPKPVVSRSLAFLIFPLFCVKMVSRIRPDRIVVSSPPINSLFLTLFFDNVIVDIRDLHYPFDRKKVPFPLPYHLLAKIFERYLINRAARRIVVAPFFQKYISDSTVITNGTDLKLFRPRKSSLKKKFGRKKIVLYSGSLSSYHDPDFLFGVIKILSSRKDILFLFVGGGNEMKRFIKRAKKLGNVKYLGIIDRAELPAYINAADVCIATMSPDYQSLSVKVLDYLACNKPTVVNIPSYGRDFKLPVLVGETPQQFADMILEGLTIKRASYRKKIEDRYDRSKLAKEFEKVIA